MLLDTSLDSARDVLESIFAWAIVYLPVAALAAWYLSTRKPEPDIPRKPRIVKSILIGLAIPGVVFGLAWALR